jgi:hydroxymethylbilane synthase
MSAIDKIRIATRESKLALWQAEFIRGELMRVHPGLEVDLIGMTTKGDRWLQAPLSELGGKGLFVKELEAAMLDGRADIAVHSVKDLPAELPAGFELPVLGYREEVNDVLVGPGLDPDDPIGSLARNARVGSSSLRRQAQLLAKRGDLRMGSIRGNVGTRLSKLAAGEFDAIVLAAAGLNRLGLARDDCHRIDVADCLPAPGQGALGIECVASSPVIELLEPLVELETAACVIAERGVSLGLGADCSLPIGASARIIDGRIALDALIAAADGSRILRAKAQGDDPLAVARDVVAQLHARGAEQILESLRG